MFLYYHFFQNFPQFIVIHTVKGFGIVKKAEIDVFLELSCFFDDPVNVSNLTSGSSAFSKTSLNIRKFMVQVLLKPGFKNFEHYFLIYAKSLQLCPTLHDPIDCSPQALCSWNSPGKKLEWVAITSSILVYEMSAIVH